MITGASPLILKPNPSIVSSLLLSLEPSCDPYVSYFIQISHCPVCVNPVEVLHLQYPFVVDLRLLLFPILFPLCNRILRGDVQCRRAENIAIGPNRLNGSSTLNVVKSGLVKDNVNFEDTKTIRKLKLIMEFKRVHSNKNKLKVSII